MIASRPRSSVLRTFLATCTLASAALLTGCGTTYVDTATKYVPAAEMKKVAQPKPVQLAFDFQTNGAPNTRATEFLRETVSKELKASGLFSSVELAPAGAGSNLLSVTLNNVPITKDAASQGFVTGLTFGLAGSAVTDGYICTVRYLPAGKSETLTAGAKHAIHTTMGNASAPANAVKSASMDEAVYQMTRDIVSTALRDLAANPNFN